MRFLALLLFAALIAGCGGLAGEPPIVSTLPPATAVPTDVGHPLSPPDMALGAQLFAQNCVQCHGTGGKGDGSLVQSGQVQAPPDFTVASTAGGQRPDEWYNTITNGNVAALMPPWGNALSEDQRWDVAMYSYTLTNTQAEIARGQQVFAADCAACDTSGFTDLAQMATVTQDALEQTIAQMPAFSGLSDADRQAVAAYVRTLGLSNVSVAATEPVPTAAPAASATEPVPSTEQAVQAPLATEEVSGTQAVSAASTQEQSATSVTINGTISNGTAGGTVPTNLAVTLFVFDANLNQKQYNANATPDGSFTIPNIPLDLASTYVATTNYRSEVYASTLLSGDALKTDAADGTLDLPISIYELTEDADVIQIAGLVTQVTVAGQSMQVAQVFNFTNTSDRAFTTSQTASNGQTISLAITLPPGAVVAADNQNRYVVDQNNFTVFDTIPVLPKEQHIVQLAYLIPYDTGAIIEQQMNYAVNGPVRLLLDPPSVQVTSQQLPPMGEQTVGSTDYQTYGGQLALASGDVLRYELSGSGLDVSANGTVVPVVSSSNLLLLVVGALIVVGLVGGGLFVIASRNRSGDQQVINVLVRQIAELDADHDAGKIADDTYERQRSALKARLASLMERKK